MNKVKVGFFSFTEITDPSQHVSYNEWHQLDHCPENWALPGIVKGERYAITPDCAAARFHADPMLAPVHYVTLYLLQEPMERSMKDFLDLGQQLDGVGRFHRARRAHMGGPFLLVKAYASPRVLVAPEAIPYRPAKGLFLTVSDIVDKSQTDAVTQWYDQVHFPDMLTVKGVAGVYWFMNVREGQQMAQFRYPNPAGRMVHVYYLDSDPLEMVADLKAKSPQWAKAGRMLDMRKSVENLYAGPLRTIVPWQWDFFEEKKGQEESAVETEQAKAAR